MTNISDNIESLIDGNFEAEMRRSYSLSSITHILLKKRCYRILGANLHDRIYWILDSQLWSKSYYT